MAKPKHEPIQNEPIDPEMFRVAPKPARDPDPIRSPVAEREPLVEQEVPTRPEPVRRGPTEEELQGLADELTPREAERLMQMLSKKLGLVGKAPTGNFIAVHGIKLDGRGPDGKPLRVRPGTVLKDLSEAEIAHLKKHGSIEPEYA